MLSHTAAIPSALVVPSSVPVGAWLTSVTSPSEAANDRTASPVAASRTSMSPDDSSPSVMTCEPSGLQSTAPPVPVTRHVIRAALTAPCSASSASCKVAPSAVRACSAASRASRMLRSGSMATLAAAAAASPRAVAASPAR